MKPRRKFSIQEKMSAVMFASNEKNRKTAAKKLGISSPNLAQWCLLFEDIVTDPKYKNLPEMEDAYKLRKLNNKILNEEPRGYLIEKIEMLNKKIDNDEQAEEINEEPIVNTFTQKDVTPTIETPISIVESPAIRPIITQPINDIYPDEIKKLKDDMISLRSDMIQMQDTYLKIINTMTGLMSTQQAMLAAQQASPPFRPYNPNYKKTYDNSNGTTSPRVSDLYDESFNRK